MFVTQAHLQNLSKLLNSLQTSTDLKQHPEFEVLGNAIYQALSQTNSSLTLYSWLVSALQQLNEQQQTIAVKKCVLLLEQRCQSSRTIFIACMRRLARVVGRRIKLHPNPSKRRLCLLFGSKNSLKSLHINLVSQIVSPTSENTRQFLNSAASSNLPLNDHYNPSKPLALQLKNSESFTNTHSAQVSLPNASNSSDDLSEESYSNSTQGDLSFELPSTLEPSPFATENFQQIETQLSELFQSRKQHAIVKRKVVPLYRYTA